MVGGWETVSVPAGAFQAIKIMINNEVKDLQTGQATSGTDTSWYAPGARRYMKMILPPLEKGDRGGFFRWMASEIPPGPPFSKGGNPNHSDPIDSFLVHLQYDFKRISIFWFFLQEFDNGPVSLSINVTARFFTRT